MTPFPPFLRRIRELRGCSVIAERQWDSATRRVTLLRPLKRGYEMFCGLVRSEVLRDARQRGWVTADAGDSR